ncbi:MAG: M20 metallopeptidase family protein [Desulfitobacteriaceae bacterium]
MEIKAEVAELYDELIRLRRDFHQHPELGYEEYRTSDIAAAYLRKCGLEVKKMSKTGVVGLLRGREPGRTLLLRADLDALAQQELNDVPYKSVYEGKMHACGHDGHIAMLLAAAKILANHQQDIKGNIKFVFQPNEETAGALDMINEGVLEESRVDAAFAIHLWSPVASGQIGVLAGPVMAANEEFELTIFGKGGHTALPETAVDPIMAAAAIIQAVQTIQSREVSVLNPTLIMFGKIQGGSGRNIVPDQVQLGGTIRFLYKNEEQEKAELKQSFERVIAGICQAMRATYELNYIPSNPALINDPALIGLVRQAAFETLGDEKLIVPYRSLAGEDFAEFTRRVPSVFYFVGIGNKEKETDYPHHHPRFNLDEDALAIGVEMHVRTALAYLNS